MKIVFLSMDNWLQKKRKRKEKQLVYLKLIPDTTEGNKREPFAEEIGKLQTKS